MLRAVVKQNNHGYEGAVESYLGAEMRLNWSQKSGIVRLSYEDALEDAKLLLQDFKSE
jgi:hypothetical protein